jgi:DNA polymerase-4
MTPAILLIDMDAFFASVEQTRRPELCGLPVIVGGEAESRGVVSTASYEARRYGVHSAMPMAQARRLCPKATFLPVDMPTYKEVQAKLLAIFGRFTDLVEPVSIDEAFLDVTGSVRLFGSPPEIAGEIQRLVAAELGLSCSIGIAPTRLLAKLAAELAKPGGLTTLTMADVHGRLRAVPVGALSGIGPVTVERLRSFHITTIGELQDVSLSTLEAAFAQMATALKELAFGGRQTTVQADHRAPKSVSREVTFATDISDAELLAATLLDLSDRLASDLRGQGYVCRTLTLKLRDAEFHTKTRQCTLSVATNTTQVIYAAARDLLSALQPPGERQRLIGLSLSGLAGAARQLALDDSWRELACDAAVDRVRAKYGVRALHRAAADLAPYHERSQLRSKTDRSTTERHKS